MVTPIPAPALFSAAGLSRETLRCGIAGIDQHLSGLPRGAITELTGWPSSGRTSAVAAIIAKSISLLEYCVYIDGSNVLDAIAWREAGVDFSRLLWVRSNHNLEAALKAADLILHAGGFGLVCLDLAGFSPRLVSRIPIAWWHRFRRAIENTPTVLLVLADHPLARSCASVWLRFERSQAVFSGWRGGRLFRGFRVCSVIEKPGRPREVRFSAVAVCG